MLSLNGHPRKILTGIFLIYAAIACIQASTKLLWCDELITFAIAGQGGVSAIWKALEGGIDPNPPLMHLMVMISTRLLGDSAPAIRLPAILCVLLALAGLWSILRRWVSPAFAALGLLAFMSTRGLDYAYDARSYAALTGFSMAGLALWLRSTDLWGRRRIACLAGMAAALALCLSSNYYGALAFLPIAAGESVLLHRSRRLRLGPWLALAVAALPIFAYLPLIRHDIAEFAPHAWNRPHLAMIADSYLELVEGLLWPVLGLALYYGWKRWRDASNDRVPARSRTYPRLLREDSPPLASGIERPLRAHELTALLVLVLYPFLGYLIALCGAGMISPRCVVPVCCAFAIATALFCSRLAPADPRCTLILLACALGWVVARQATCSIILVRQRIAFSALRGEIESLPPDRPLLVSDSLLVLPLAHYSSEEVRRRIVFPIDFDSIHRLEAEDSGEQNLWAGRFGVFPVRIVRADADALERDQPLIVIARPGGWLTQFLLNHRFRLDPVARNGLSGSSADFAADPAWQRLGGVFTALAHEESRLMSASRTPAPQ